MRPFLVISVLLSACGATSTPSVADMATSTTTDLAHALIASPCLPSGAKPVAYVTDSPVRSFDHAEPSLEAGKSYVAAVDTDVGCFVIELNTAKAPMTTSSFVFLALHHFFEGIAFHRVIDGFVAQGGDPNTIDGSPSSWGIGNAGYQFGLEVDPSLNYDAAGVVGMARSDDPSTNSSQFFITLAAVPSLDQKYTIFGKVAVGLAVLPKIVRGEPPTTPSRIRTVVIATK